MHCLVFALAMIFAGCSTHSQLGAGGSGESRSSSAQPGPETTVIWLDNQERFPTVGFFDVETIFSETDLGIGSYVRIAALHVTGTSRKALLGMLRLRASQIGANRLLIVKVEEKKEEVFLYSGLGNVARFFSGEEAEADRRDEAYTLRIDAIAIRQADDLSSVYRYRPGDDRSTVYRPRRPYDRSTVYRPRRPRDRSGVYRPPRRDDRRSARPPRRSDDRPTASPSLPKDEPSSVKPPPTKDETPAVKPPPPPPEDGPSPLKRPRMKTHRP